MLAHIIEAGVAANHGAGLVLRLIHDLAVVGPVELGHGYKRSTQGVRRIVAAQILLGNQVDILGRHPPRSNLLIFAQRHKYTPF